MATSKQGEPIKRPDHFPQHWKLERLLKSYDPEIGYFELTMWRRQARDLRKWLFGPKGSRIVPEFDGNLNHYDAVMEFDLPRGWTLRLTYGAPSWEIEAGEVDAEFIPPISEESPGQYQREEVRLNAEGKPPAETPALV
jgi:hypothetical protein